MQAKDMRDVGYELNEVPVEFVMFRGYPVLFTEARIDKSSIPNGFFKYEIRHSDYDDRVPMELAHSIMVNYYGSIITDHEFMDFDDDGYYKLTESESPDFALPEYLDDLISENEDNPSVTIYMKVLDAYKSHRKEG